MKSNRVIITECGTPPPQLVDNKLIQPNQLYNDSGTYAMHVAYYHGNHDIIFLLGFDFGSTDDKFNNVYADTEFYKKSTDKPTFAGNWIYQINEIAKAFPRVTFFRVKDQSSSDVDFTNNNIVNIMMDEFKLKINKL